MGRAHRHDMSGGRQVASDKLPKPVDVSRAGADPPEQKGVI